MWRVAARDGRAMAVRAAALAAELPRRLAVDDDRAMSLKAPAFGAMLVRLLTVVDGRATAVRAHALALVWCDAWLLVTAKLLQ